MLKKLYWLAWVIIIIIILYFVVWPVPVDPVGWEAPPNPGYTGPFAVNTRLKGVETFPIAGNHGPEDIAIDAQGRIYAATHEGYIVRLNPDASDPQNWVHTKGRPLGIDFDGKGNLMIDKLSEKPFMREVIQRLPAFLRPKAVAYGHIIAIDDSGNVLIDLQDPDGEYPINTSVTETNDYLYIGSLVTPVLGRLKKDKIGL